MPTSSNSREVANFAGFQLDLWSGELRRDGVLVKLQPQPAKVLVLLASRAGKIITRAELAEEVWGSETFVDFEHGLNYAIRQIRTALEDDAEQPRFLETIPKRGYRFIAPVTKVAEEGLEGPVDSAAEQSADRVKRLEPSPGARAQSSSRMGALVMAGVIGLGLVMAGVLAWEKAHVFAPAANRLVLAVLPFDDLSPTREPYLEEGLTEEMIAQLTRINPGRLKVIARTSAMQYAHTKKNARQIGQELGADYILENSIRRENGKVRVTTQLVRTADQTHLWAETYEKDMAQLLLLEREVAEEIAQQIHVQLIPVSASSPMETQSIDGGAHELYLQARSAFNLRSREGLAKSIELYTQALAKDPSYAAAYAGLADAYNLQAFYGFDPTMSSVSQAKVAAMRALEIDDSMAAAHAALAYTDFMWREDWPAAEREFRRAMELDDNYVPGHQWWALYLAAQDRMDEAVKTMQFAQLIDPLSPSVHAGLGYMYYLARDYEQAVRQAQVALQLNPNFMVAHAVLGWSYVEEKKFPEAIRELETASQLSGGVPVYRSALGRAYALSGNMPAARKILAELEARKSQPLGVGSALAEVYLATGDEEHALHWLEQTAPGDVQFNWVRVDPAYDPLRGNRQFMALLARVGVKQE